MQQEVTLLLITVITTETACQQLVAADGVRPLLALISLPERELPNVAQTRSCALHLISRICAHNGAPALLAAGAAVPVIREMMRAAMIANWTGRTGSADAVDSRAAAEASKDAGQALSVLAAFGAIGDSGVEAVRHAVRQASALPALVALLACRQEEVHKAAATILALLDPTDKAQLTVLENSGGITLLCETLVSTSAAEATHLQAMQALATLSAAPTSAVAIAEYPRALATYVNIIVAPPTETAKAAALTTLANLSSLGALSLEPLRSLPFQSALAGVIMATKGRAHGGAHTEARTAALGLLAKVSEDRLCRRELVLLNLPPALSMAISEGGEGARHATHALSHFAADDTFRLQLASWGALPPLAQQLSASTQLDARTRAMALSALANFSYVDPTALSAVPGVLATLGRLLFEQDAAVLTMALTALSNLVGFAETVAPALLAAGTPRAVHALLSHNDHHVVEQSLATLLKLSGDRALAGAFVEVPGAITSVVFLIGSSEPNAAVPLAAALGAMLESRPEARGAALEAGGAAALGTALLGCTEADGRLVLALTLAAVVRGDWDAIYAACGWPAVLAVLNVHVAAKAAAAQKGMLEAFLGSDPRSEALHKASAQGTAALLARQGAAREALGADPTAVRFVAHTLGACTSDEALVADGTFALGTAYAIVLLLGCAASRKYVGTEYAAEGLHATRQLATNPKLAGALAQAGAVPLLIVHMSASEPNAAVPLAAALGAMLESWPEARGAALEAGGAAALGTALLGCTEADGRTVLALTLAAVVRGDVGAAQAACGWQGIIAVLVAAAATVSTPLRELAAAAEPGLAAAVAGASPKAPGTAQPAAAPAVGEAVTKPKPLVGPQAVKMLAYDDEKPQPVRTSLKSRPAANDLD